PNPLGDEVSKRVYRMLCDHPSKLFQFDALLKACGREIQQAAKDVLKYPQPCDETKETTAAGAAEATAVFLTNKELAERDDT
ncbi:MAG: hypothetical protein ACRD2L_05625, partial [Terriglobia bacterium]